MPIMVNTRTVVLVSMLVLLPLVLFACNGEDDTSAPTSGVRTTDEQYLKVICSGLTNFSDAVVSKTSSAEIAAVIKAYIASMKEINPPADLDKFHQDFLKYLQTAVDEPTSLITRTPPLPPDSVRRRIASKEPNVPECRDATFFDASSKQP
jgi:hypothetical protein